MQINTTGPLPVRPARAGAVVLIATLTVTITKNQPSPADDTPMRHADIGRRLMGIRNEDQIRRTNDA